MTDQMRDDQLDNDIRSFLAWRAEDIAGAPSATEVAMGIKARSGTRTLVPGISAQLAWLLIAALLAVGLIGAAVVGANLLRDNRSSVIVAPTPTVAPITGSMPAEQMAVIARHAAALNSRNADAFVDVFATGGAFNPRGTFASPSMLLSNRLPIADRSFVEPVMAINDAWGFEGEVVTCDQLSRSEYADRYGLYGGGDLYGHCAVRSRWPALSLEIGEWWSFEFKGTSVRWWGQTVRDAAPLNRALPLGLDGLLEWEAWLQSTDPDAAARLLNPRSFPITSPCDPCEWSSDGVDVERITSGARQGRGEDSWVIGGQSFAPSALIPYDPADATQIEASIDEFLSQRGDTK